MRGELKWTWGKWERWQGLYTKGLQNLTFLAGLAHFLLYSSLISLSEVTELLGVRPSVAFCRTLGGLLTTMLRLGGQCAADGRPEGPHLAASR